MRLANMVTSALHEEYARNILKVYRHFGLHTGEALNSNNFLAAGMNNRWDTKELQGGLNRAIEKGWVENADRLVEAYEIGVRRNVIV